MSQSDHRKDQVVRPKKQSNPTTSSNSIEIVTSNNDNKSESSKHSEQQETSSEYARRLAASAPRKVSSKASSRATSKASSAARLQVKLEEAEAKVEAEFSREMTERAQRQLSREINQKQQELKRKEEERRSQLEDEAEEREALLRKKRASIQARKEVIDALEEERSERADSLSLGLTEVTPMDKAAAFVGGIGSNGNEKIPVELTVSNKNSEINSFSAPLRLNDQETVGRCKAEPLYTSSVVFTSGTMPTYTSPMTDSHYAWASKQAHHTNLPSKLVPKIEPSVFTRIATNDKMSTPVLRDRGSNPNAPKVFPPTLHEQSYIKPSESPHEHLHYSGGGNTSSADRVIEAVCSQMALSRLPLTQPDVFDGRDSLQFPVWKMTFDSLINHGSMSATDKLNLLNRFVGGEAKIAIQGYLLLPPSEAFKAAYNLLLERYGDSFNIANEFRNRLKLWPKVGGTDTTGLRNLVDFLKQCRTAKQSFPSLKILDDESENTELTRKLPAWLSRQWARKVATHRATIGQYPSFEEFVDFLTVEDNIAHDPLARTLQSSEGAKEKRKGSSFASGRGSELPVSEAGNGKNFGMCRFCGDRHSLQVCKKFGSEPFETRRRFVIENQLCFACLIKGHISRECRNRKECQTCQGMHPTSLHRSEPSTEEGSSTLSVTACASSHHAINTPLKSSMVVPVRISHMNYPDREVVVYAMLDTQSDSTFITDNAARSLGLEGKAVRLSLSTMTANNKVIKCERYDGLVVRNFEGNCDIKLPGVYSRKSIPINHSHIPCGEMLSNWPHLNSLKHKLVPRMNYEVGMLIGYDCPKALIPREVITAADSDDGPFGLRTDLGWGVVGVISHSTDLVSDHIGFSHRIVATQTTGSQLILPKRVKETVSPTDCLRVMERDFLDRNCNGEEFSLNERRFLKLMDERIKVDDSLHYSMPLPFNDNKGKLFNNKAQVMKRTMSLKRKMIKDRSYRAEYTEFMEEMVRKGFAEEVDDSLDSNSSHVWYLPHFGVFHKTKGKLRVVFDCAAKYENISLNDTLMKGPDYINSLTGILCRFRKHPVAFSCDVEKMFYAFHVHPEDRDYLRFLWWRKGDVSVPLSTYRMTAHLFGAISSPACASFGLRRIAKEFVEYGEDVLDFISHDFYVDDGLRSVRNEEDAISLVRRTVELCSKRGVRLHKFVSNSDELMKSLPETECASKNHLLSLDLEEYPTERVLGILWNARRDVFQFKVNASRNPRTRRELLSVTSSIFDPLGWIAPFTLRARLILQQICREGLEWDDQASPFLLNRWESWYKETVKLSDLSISRCLRYQGCSEPINTQLHHFADASEDAYGACSYLRTTIQCRPGFSVSRDGKGPGGTCSQYYHTPVGIDGCGSSSPFVK